jgi:hypothetical protein
VETTLSSSARAELIVALGRRYRTAAKPEKTRMLEEMAKLVGCHRKHAIRLLRSTSPVRGYDSAEPALPGRRGYDDSVREALIVLWEAADRICAKRLKALLPSLVDAMERHGHLQMEPSVRVRILAISAATIDRLLRHVREGAKARPARRRGANKLARKIPIKTFSEWDDAQPGELEMDMVAHCGGNMHGSFIHSLVATDVCSGWTEAVPLLAREQSVVVAGMAMLKRRFQCLSGPSIRITTAH